ncbi:adenosylcobinamide-phosphate synthase CbiB [Thermoflavimicrobium dichotomicum]|uniref:Cobalamin biosynthesis protein CobD n=1 Tax=Thermoflavimicrobium dichotomicum TaxID=46223 RepID=A0A1I3MIX5_9BACL|nr:adenosylcobinamide-phosphate synthase CbiB [Thermoflavimicrobium dichotomicum]SFI96626.1 adenosylcobinamide-phosphate synthase [Thermoflavimicrobium dichotomicum]
MMKGVMMICAYLLDRMIGDPDWLPHPVVGMGKAISRLDRLLQHIIHRYQWNHEIAVYRIRSLGLLFPIVIVGGVYGVAFFLVKWVSAWNEWLGWGLELFLVATTIATKGLADAGREIYQALVANDLPKARHALSMVVGRDTDQLDESEIVRGGVETVAENIVDGVTAPLFYAAIGGAPLALAYRAVNTLDSMVGYKNEKYLHLGWASARLDDLANWVPARITLIPMFLAMWILHLDPRKAWQVVRRDAHRHPSPNSGYPEAAMAGGLHIQLGGVNTYQGRVSQRALLGEPLAKREPAHLLQAIRVLYLTTFLYAGLISLILFAFDYR